MVILIKKFAIFCSAVLLLALCTTDLTRRVCLRSKKSDIGMQWRLRTPSMLTPRKHDLRDEEPVMRGSPEPLLTELGSRALLARWTRADWAKARFPPPSAGVDVDPAEGRRASTQAVRASTVAHRPLVPILVRLFQRVQGSPALALSSKIFFCSACDNAAPMPRANQPTLFFQRTFS